MIYSSHCNAVFNIMLCRSVLLGHTPACKTEHAYRSKRCMLHSYCKITCKIMEFILELIWKGPQSVTDECQIIYNKMHPSYIYVLWQRQFICLTPQDTLGRILQFVPSTNHDAQIRNLYCYLTVISLSSNPSYMLSCFFNNPFANRITSDNTIFSITPKIHSAWTHSPIVML